MEEMTNVIECTNDLKADWCVQKIKELREEKDRLVGIVDAEIEELLAKKESIISNTEHEVGYFSTALYKYFEGLENKKDAKTQQSYRTAAVVATITCLIGAILFFAYNEKKLLGRIKELKGEE